MTWTIHLFPSGGGEALHAYQAAEVPALSDSICIGPMEDSVRGDLSQTHHVMARVWYPGRQAVILIVEPVKVPK